ncbi:MAG: hypothetical protein PHR25_05465 [Clostridia bacterium]|nr:hypothetical protein [Clostridia bacterium]MDD4376213.1 hypothetical protein [Clostridia bacterium]
MELQMNKFEIVDLPGMQTIAFLVERNDEEYRKGNALFTLQKLESTGREEEGKLKKTFSVLNTDERQYVVLLTLDKSRAILSTGEITEDGFVSKDNAIPLSYGSVYNQEGVEYKEFTYTPSMKRQFAIIDTSIGEEVKPTLYVDKITNEVKGKCKILPLRPYIVLELRLDKK